MHFARSVRRYSHTETKYRTSSVDKHYNAPVNIVRICFLFRQQFRHFFPFKQSSEIEENEKPLFLFRVCVPTKTIRMITRARCSRPTELFNYVSLVGNLCENGMRLFVFAFQLRITYKSIYYRVGYA